MTDSDNAVANGDDGHGESEPAQPAQNDPSPGGRAGRRAARLPTWHFQLGFGVFTPTRPNEANYAAYMRLKTAPPGGCAFEEDYGYARLRCRRTGPNRLAAVGQLVREIRTVYGLIGTDDLGIEKLWEWSSRDREWAENIAGQLLLMGASRAEHLGLDVEDVVAFVRDAMAPPLTLRHAAGRSRPRSGAEPGPDAGSPSDAGADSGPDSGPVAP